MNEAPWEYDIDWDEVNILVTFDGQKPKPNEDVLMIGYSFDGVIKSPARLREWPQDQLGGRFIPRVFDAIFESYNIELVH
jgi:hypothetical protein